ncbi:MAG: phage tail tape measure protein [Nitrososphaerota archaeon]
MPVEEFVLKAIFEAEDRLSGKISDVQSKLARLGDETEHQGSRMSSIFSDVGKVAAGVLGGLFGYELIGRIRSFVEESIKNFAEFERESVKLASLSRRAGQDVGELAQVFRTIASAAANQFAVSGREALSSLEALIKAGLSGRDAMSALGSAIMMARIEGVDFEVAANNLVQVMAQFGLSGREAARVVDALTNASRLGIGTANDFARGLADTGATAKALGLSLEDTTTWLVVLEKRFGSAQEAGTHLNRFLLELYEIANKLGVPIRDTSGALRDTNAVIQDVIKAAKEMGGDFNMLQERLKGVDMRAIKALLTLSQMTESFSELRNEIGRAGTSAEAFGEMMDTISGRFDRMQTTVDRASRRIGESAGNIAVTLGNYVLPAVQYAFDAWSGIIATAVGDAKTQLESAIDAQLTLGRITQQQAADWIMAWLEMGKITEKEAMDIAGRTLTLEAIMTSSLSSIIEKHLQAGEEIPDVLKPLAHSYEELRTQSQKTGDVLVQIAGKFGITSDRALELAKKVLGLELAFDEHADAIKKLTIEYGITEEQARELIEALEREAEAAKKAKEEEERHRQAVEDARNTLISSVQALLEYGGAFGPLTSNIRDAEEALRTLTEEGEKVPSKLQDFLKFMTDLNSQFSSLERQARTVSAAQSVAATGASYYSAITQIQEGLIADQIIQLERQIDELKQQEEALRQSGDAAKYQIEVIRQQRAELEQQLQKLKDSTQLTVEQAASQERLAGIQQMLGFTSQIVSLQQTALQLAMMGADETANTFMNTSIALADALSDGVITQEEYKNILTMLGVTFDEQGRPVINLKNIMDEFKNKLVETQDQVNSFRETLSKLDGTTIHTYHYHHEITVTGTKKEETEEWIPRPNVYQAGAWYTPEGLAYLHRGEMVLPRPVAEWFRKTGSAAMKNINISINITTAGEEPTKLADTISRELARRLRAM